ncbi:hypothetical protein GCM10023115_56280 [Pontixanthobacter gangjinensis]|uniref:Sensory/regulatory protein RpfC n=1 Tax=Pontixanthobacter gangjinensis TaxID=1028742 RepID=A0A6I4SPS6_9SPHN|nr:MASE1 domain-containing protein [Pontixanthobacter gangjinensis]MXO57911.1 response regulator [Pontixanthobacter gangjinensis]
MAIGLGIGVETQSKLMGTTAFQPAKLAASFTRYLIAAILFGVIAFAAIELTRGNGRIAMVWIPNAIAVAILLRWKVRHEAVFLLMMWAGNVSANLLAGDAPEIAAALAFCNAIEISVALALTRRFTGRHPDMRRIDDLMQFVFFAGICAPAVAATLAMLVLDMAGIPLAPAWLKWLVTDGLGMILIAPSLLIFIDAARAPRRLTKLELVEWPVIFACSSAVTIVVFSQTQFPLLFLIPLVVLVHAFRMGSLGTALAILKIGFIATFLTWMESGPIHLSDHSQDAQLMVLQAFLATAFIIGLPIAAILNKQRSMIDNLEDREARLSLLADNMSDAVMRYNMQGECTFASASVADVLGRPVHEFLGRRPTDNIHPDEMETIPAIQMRLLKGESDKERFTYRRLLDDAEGRPAFIEADCVLVRDAVSNEAQTIIVSCRDVSDRIRLEKKLVRARRHAENAASAKSQFLANMSHEIRTPMNGVLGFVELLLQADLPEEQRRHAKLIQDSGNSMMSLLNDILDISKIEAGQVKLHPEPVEVRDCIMSCLSLYAANAVQKNITLQAIVADDLPAQITTDGLRLRQIILNLLGNAVKFANEGDIYVEAKCDRDDLVVAVTDNGIGIEKQRLDAIFRPFEQGDTSTSRKYGGTGLGLPISRNLAELLGGSLSATSTLGQGSKFELRIPLKISDGHASVVQEPELAATTELLAGSRILLAEDHDINQILVMAMLERCDQDVELAEDGQKAVTAVMTAKAQGRPFHLVLMDIQMPECDGYTATKTIRELGISADDLPIVALTANAFADDREAAIQSGMQGHLSKPLKFELLENTLRQWLPTKPIPPEIAPQPMTQSGILEPQPVEPEPVEPEAVGPEVGKVTSMEKLWQARRSEALAAVSQAIRSGMNGDASLEELARTVHKLAGTAGMFGEEELGIKASALERGLKADLPNTERLRLAEALLNAA